MSFPEQAADLARLGAASRRRHLIVQAGVDFSSNDYLGLAASGLLADAARAALDSGVPVGSGGSRLLRGNHAEHIALEDEAAVFYGHEAALFMATGYAANSALFATLPQTGDVIIHDELVHASAHEGFRLSRAAAHAFAHNNVDAAESAIRKYRLDGGRGRVWLAVESLYSMDGDQAPLDALMALAIAQDAVLVVDEAHATGVFGPHGKGLSAHLAGQDNLITLRTLGKALGCEGALLTMPSVVKDFLVNRARGLIFSTAPSPLMAAVARSAIGLAASRDDLREALWKRVRLATSLLKRLGASQSGSQILPVILGDDTLTMTIADRLQSVGLDVRGIRPPTVPEGTSRLRISITNNASEADIARLANELAAARA